MLITGQKAFAERDEPANTAQKSVDAMFCNKPTVSYSLAYNYTRQDDARSVLH